MASDIEPLFQAAWAKVWPTLKRDPDELARRLARRRTKALTRPPRAWCLAVRASDRRINPATAYIDPPEAAYPHSHVAEPLRGYFPYGEHTVTLTADLLKRICRPVYIEPPGEELTRVAEKLGTHPNALRRARARGIFEVRRIPLLGGKRGWPVPVLYTRDALDPSSCNLFQPADPIWCAMWGRLADMVPAGFEQTLTRVPLYYAVRGRRVSFRRWLWVCPGCKRKVWTMYYPLPPITLTEFYGIDPSPNDADETHRPPPCFACHKCHDVCFFSRASHDAWNMVVSYLSGGLLYGHEVERPAWLTKDRKRAYKPRLSRAPSVRRPQVMERLLQGWRYAKIAKDLGINKANVGCCARHIYRQYGVHSREALRKKLKKITKSREAAALEELSRTPPTQGLTSDL